jgi:hypothetical protein
LIPWKPSGKKLRYPPKYGPDEKVKGTSKKFEDFPSSMTSWYDHPIVHMNTLGDGSCLVHSILNAMFLPYQEATDSQKAEMASDIRKDLSLSLNERVEGFPEYARFWSIQTNCAFVANTVSEMESNENSEFSTKYNFLEKLLNSSKYLGNESYSLLAELLGIDIIVCIGKKEIFPLVKSVMLPRRNTVVIYGTGGHYETMGVREELQNPESGILAPFIRTLFPPDHDFILSLLGGNENDFPRRMKPKDFDFQFIHEFVTNCHRGAHFDFPSFERKIANEPVLLLGYNALKERIQESCKNRENQ